MIFPSTQEVIQRCVDGFPYTSEEIFSASVTMIFCIISFILFRLKEKYEHRRIEMGLPVKHKKHHCCGGH